jgi:TolA-binding protein
MISDPGYLEILLKIGDVYEKLGNTRSAIMAYQTLYEQCPDHTTAKERLERLNRDVF